MLVTGAKHWLNCYDEHTSLNHDLSVKKQWQSLKIKVQKSPLNQEWAALKKIKPDSLGRIQLQKSLN